ncbi:MAG TPA: glycosyltransferase family 39 protein [Vicinamibacterales bacterium]|nr:glycosyltransferase family 39 protein [Vicinamibacterales bacterium]
MIDREPRLRRAAWTTLPAIAAGVVGLASLAVSAIPFERVQRAVDAFAADGHAESFTAALHHAAVVKVRLVAIVLLASAPVLFRFRDAIAARVASETADVIAYLSDWTPVRLTTSVVLAMITAIGAIVRALALRQPVNYDEAFTFITYVRRPLWVSVSDYSYPNNHVLHTMLAHASTTLFGIAPPALRLPAFAAGVALIPLTFIAARKLCDETTAIVAAALAATAEVLIAFSVLARGYTLVTAWFLLMLVFAVDVAVRDDRRAWTPFVIAAALGFFTIPTFVYAFAVVSAWILWTAPRTAGSLAKAAVATAVLVALLYLPILLVSGIRAGAAYGYGSGDEGGLIQFLRAWWTDLARGANPFAAALVAIAAGVGGVTSGPHVRRLAIVSIGCAAMAVVAQRIVMPPRVWLFAVPVLLMLVASAGATVVRHRRPIVLPIALLITLDAFRGRPAQYTEVYGPEEIAMTRDVEPATVFLKDRLKPEDAVATAFPTIDLVDYYFRLHTMPIDALRNPPHAPARTFIVANDRAGNDVGSIVREKHLDIGPERPQLLMRAEFNAVYLLSERSQ